MTEQPAGSNRDRRKDGITAAQVKVAGGGSWLIGQAWCGVWACMAALAGGVKIAKPYRWASVRLIKADAQAKVNGFRGWIAGAPSRSDWETHIFRGDKVIWFDGSTDHVETVRSIDFKRRLVVTEGGNTSSGPGGSQSNGGGAFKRFRPFSAVTGFALVNFPDK
ncbi:MAG: hypothetical protein H0W81_06490 [Chloroflexi bacterium]|nr:hypothetical protein [Chloroflexota bacterium]